MNDKAPTVPHSCLFTSLPLSLCHLHGSYAVCRGWEKRGWEEPKADMWSQAHPWQVSGLFSFPAILSPGSWRSSPSSPLFPHSSASSSSPGGLIERRTCRDADTPGTLCEQPLLSHLWLPVSPLIIFCLFHSRVLGLQALLKKLKAQDMETYRVMWCSLNSVRVQSTFNKDLWYV